MGSRFLLTFLHPFSHLVNHINQDRLDRLFYLFWILFFSIPYSVSLSINNKFLEYHSSVSLQPDLSVPEQDLQIVTLYPKGRWVTDISIKSKTLDQFKKWAKKSNLLLGLSFTKKVARQNTYSGKTLVVTKYVWRCIKSNNSCTILVITMLLTLIISLAWYYVRMQYTIIILTNVKIIIMTLFQLEYINLVKWPCGGSRGLCDHFLFDCI